MTLSVRPIRWIWAAIWIAVIWSSAWLVGTRLILMEQEQFHSFNKERLLSALDETGPEQKLVVAFGTSLMRAATPNDGNARDAFGGNIKWLRIVKPAASWHDYLEILELLGSHHRRADMIVIHDELFLESDTRRARTPDPDMLSVEALRLRIRYTFKFGFKESPWERFYDRIEGFEQSYGCQTMVLDEARRLFAAQRDIYRANTPVAPEALAFVRRAKELSERVVAVNIQRASELSDTDNEANTHWSSSLRGSLAQEDVDYLSLPRSLDHRYYCDYRHLNEGGRAMYSEYIATQIRGRLQ